MGKDEKIKLLIGKLSTAISTKSKTHLEDYIKTSYSLGTTPEDLKVISFSDVESIMKDPNLSKVWNNRANPVYKPSKNNQKDEVDLVEIAEQLLSPKYLQARNGLDENSADIELFSIKSKDSKICAPVSNNYDKAVKYLESVVATTLREGDIVMKPAERSTLVSEWLRHTKFTDVENDKTLNVYKYGNPYIMKDDWVEFRAEWVPNENCPFPELQATFSRMKYGPQVAALIWGTYAGQYKGRQCLWLYGEDGKEGKSTVAKFFGEKLFGVNYGYKSLQDAQISDGKRFANASVEGAKLIIFPDSSDQYLLDNDLVKALAGRRDSVSSEAKFKDAKTISIDATLFVLSNFLPVVKDADYSTSRVLVCPMYPKTTEDGSKEVVLNPNIALEYEKELPGFLHWAKTQFESLYKGDEIQMPLEYSEYIRTIIDRTDSERKRIITENFVFDEEGTIKAEVFRVEVKNASEYRSSEITSFINWFKKTYPNVSLRKHGNITYFKGIRVKTNPEKEKENLEFNEMVRKGKLSDLNDELDNFSYAKRGEDYA